MPAGEETRGLPDISPRILSVYDLALLPEPTWLVDGMIPSGGRIVVLSGFAGTGKTFLALDLACSLATGIRWLHRAVEPANVLYVPQEGLYDVKPRVWAWRMDRGVDEAALDRLSVWGDDDVLALDDPADRDKLEAVIVRYTIDLVVIDTLSVSLGNVDENNATEMRPVLAALRGLVKRTGITLLLLMHAGWQRNRERGSTAVRSEADALIHLDKEAEGASDTQVRCLKSRSVAPFPTVRFALRSVPGGSAPVVAALGQVKDLRARVLDRIRAKPFELTRSDVKAEVHGDDKAIGGTVTALMRDGAVVTRNVSRPCAGGRSRTVEVLGPAEAA